MGNEDAMKEFKEGLDLMHNSFPRQALVHFRNAADLDRNNPFYLSYLGLALAMFNRNYAQAIDICDDAVRMKRSQPELYLNLAEVYRLAGKKEDAIGTLTTGSKLTKQDPRVVEALRKMGMRKPPVLAFLDRKNFLNVQLGKIRSKVLAGRGKGA